MTLGLNQLRVDHWEAYLKSKNLSCGWLSIIRAGENASSARAATDQYLRLGQNQDDSLMPLSQIYTGRRNVYYDAMLSYAFRLVGNRNSNNK